MYKVIGADGKEYGPVSAEQLRQWIAEGRANGQTKVLADGATEWKALGQMPEFAAVLGGIPAPIGAPPVAGVSNADVIAQEILARDYHIDIGHCVSRGWNLVMKRFWLTVGATFIILLVDSAIGAVPFLGAIGTLALAYVLWGGLDWMFLKLVRGQPADLGDAFAGFSLAFVPLLLFSLVGQLLTCVGFLLCILPGIYLTVAWMLFTALLILDKRLEFWPAMELSRKVVTRHWWQLFGLCVVTFLLLLAGLVACVVGFFVALPVAIAAIVYAYEDIFGTKTVVPAQPVPTAPVPPS